MNTGNSPPLTPRSSVPPSTRILGIDVIRALAILSVIYLHTTPPNYAGAPYDALWDVIAQFTRFAVPFFFIASGYLLSRKLTLLPESASKVLPYIRRISSLYLIWYAIYLLFPHDWMTPLLEGNLKPFYWHLSHTLTTLTNDPLTFISKPTRVHLWFLPALIFGASMLALAIRYRASQFFLPLASGLYVVGLLAEDYSNTRYGLTISPHWGIIIGFCYSPLFVGMGWKLATGPIPKLSTAVLCIVIGFTLQLAEASWIWHQYGQSMRSSAYLIGTIPFGLGFMLLGLTLPPFRGDRMLAIIGSMTLGIYLIHIWVKSLLHPLNKIFGGVVWELSFPILVFAVSLLLTTRLSRSRFRSIVV